MRGVRRAASALCVAAFASAYVVTAAVPASAATKVVFTTSSNTFSPGTTSIFVNDAVSWTNPLTTGGANHTVTSTSSNWSYNESIAIPGSSTPSPFKFTKAGTYKYQCSFHGAPMSGSVVVKVRPRPTPSRTTAPPRSATPEPSSSTSDPSPEPSTSSASPGFPSASPSAVPSNPLPTVAPRPTRSPLPATAPDLGSGGLTASPPTGRERGLPMLVAVVFLVGVIAAEVRTLLVTPLDE